MKIGSVYIEITNRCNLNCVDCYNASGHSTVTSEISPVMLAKIIDHFHLKYGVKSFSISGGEPLMHSGWHQMVDVMERYDSLSFFIVTNGTMWDEYYMKLLERDSRFHIQYSVDGADEQTHALTRGPGSFSGTIENISKSKTLNTPIIKMVITKLNYNHIEEYFVLAGELGCLPTFSFAEKLGNAACNWNELNLSEAEKIIVMKNIEKLNARYNIKSKPPLATFKCTLLSSEDELSICIKPNGNIQPCQNFYDDSFALGSVYSLDSLDIERKAADFSSALRERLNIDYGCARCINKGACDRGCAAAAYMKHGDIMASDDDCKLRKLQTAFIPVMDYIKRRGE